MQKNKRANIRPVGGRILKTAVVTGPTGVVGSAVCETLLNEKCTVYAVCRPGCHRLSALPKHDRLYRIECDLAEIERVPELVPEGVDAFFHFAWAYTAGPRKADMPSQIKNIQATIASIRVAAEMGCKVFVGSGSQAEYGCTAVPLRPDTPVFPETAYGMAKLCAGQMGRLEAKRVGIDYIWPRLVSVYGPHDGESVMIISVIRQLLAGKVPALTKGEQMWDFLYASDAGEAIYRAARYGKDGSVYVIGSGVARPLKEFVVEMRDTINPALSLGFGKIPYQEKDVMFLQADITDLQKDTGFIPQIPFSEGLKKTIEWVKKEYYG